MSNSEQDRNLALAAICQAAALVQQTARKGDSPSDYFEASIHSLLVTKSENTEEIFGGLDKVRLGFVTLQAQLSNKPMAKDAEITRYVASILGLERKLANKPSSMQDLAERIGHLQRQQSHIDLFSSQMITNIASVYSDVVSPIGPKIQVSGVPVQLKQPVVQHKVRALLLAGVRAAVLWRQLGGKRRNILLQRRKILHLTESTLSQLQHSH